MIKRQIPTKASNAFNMKASSLRKIIQIIRERIQHLSQRSDLESPCWDIIQTYHKLKTQWRMI